MSQHTVSNCKPCNTHTRRTVSFLVILTALVVAMQVLTGCSSTSPDAAPAPAKPASVVGTWVSAAENNVSFEAIVENGQIVVNLVDGDTKSLFWKGTFPDQTAPATIKSVGDREALDSSMLGSSETEKPFTYTGDELTFEFSMMGTSTNVHTTKK